MRPLVLSAKTEPEIWQDEPELFEFLLTRFVEIGMERDDLLLIGHTVDPDIGELPLKRTVSYTHLTLPTILRV